MYDVIWALKKYCRSIICLCNLKYFFLFFNTSLCLHVIYQVLQNFALVKGETELNLSEFWKAVMLVL